MLGLKAARSEEPDLILLDLDMPDISGFDVCRSLKADAELCMIPVLFLSGSTTPEDKIVGLDLGAVDYVTKPFDAFELRARVRAALRTKHLQDMLFEHAHIDPLTGLPNRRALMERLQQEWARIERHGGRLSFIMADIDDFKSVNDRFGHHVGDKILQKVAGAHRRAMPRKRLAGAIRRRRVRHRGSRRDRGHGRSSGRALPARNRQGVRRRAARNGFGHGKFRRGRYAKACPRSAS